MEEGLTTIDEPTIALALARLLELRGSPPLVLDKYVSPVIVVGQLSSGVAGEAADPFLDSLTLDASATRQLYSQFATVIAFGANRGYHALRNDTLDSLLLVTACYVQSGVTQSWNLELHQPGHIIVAMVPAIGVERRDGRLPAWASTMNFGPTFKTDASPPVGSLTYRWDTTGMLAAKATYVVIPPGGALSLSPAANTQTFFSMFEFERLIRA